MKAKFKLEDGRELEDVRVISYDPDFEGIVLDSKIPDGCSRIAISWDSIETITNMETGEPLELCDECDGVWSKECTEEDCDGGTVTFRWPGDPPWEEREADCDQCEKGLVVCDHCDHGFVTMEQAERNGRIRAREWGRLS